MGRRLFTVDGAAGATIHVGAGAPARPAGHSPAGFNLPAKSWRATLAHPDGGVRASVCGLSRLCQPRHTVSGQTRAIDRISLFINTIQMALYL